MLPVRRHRSSMGVCNVPECMRTEWMRTLLHVNRMPRNMKAESSFGGVFGDLLYACVWIRLHPSILVRCSPCL